MLRKTEGKRSPSMGDAEMETYGPGTKAYLKSWDGLVPCVVVAVSRPCNGMQDSLLPYGELLVRVSRSNEAYRAGEVVPCRAVDAPPRECVSRGPNGYAINAGYWYLPSEEE